MLSDNYQLAFLCKLEQIVNKCMMQLKAGGKHKEQKLALSKIPLQKIIIMDLGIDFIS